MLDFVEQLIAANADLADVGTPQPDQEIRNAEETLGLKFPESFTDYLKRWGWVSFGPNEYLGLGATMQNIVRETGRARLSCNLPNHMIVVCDHDGDEFVCIDTSERNNGECRVIVWDCPSKSYSRYRAKDFASFLEDDMRAFLE
ncbi:MULTISPECIES: SMI1/KNR4 family protein [unclassified Duganella]|uniref:SMI1/KNR4 family protein n=1 Tax=unclassified Duganella TaxID=2636909 RepID=UPI0009EA4EA3|nr:MULTISPECIES: SMI1/KNR4 family protein [unclassified Duganella]